ncbi:V-type proton ATPase subunit G-like [Pollicipes pollicipes]|uniref:V-type proton ATPase subunit G-like n=1 Tax=Pollicipes pollicipes TaxID=41117 RepID=UPI001884F56B|nr:V-type proton ATPase subunit G-like [Pollicipes pollicipes]
MTRTSEGITALLAAEKKATEKIEESKRRKVRTLKAAKEEADKEVELLQREHERQFKNSETANTDSKDAMVTRVDAETAQRLKAMQAEVVEHKEKIIARILEKVYEITPQMHENVRFDQEED